MNNNISVKHVANFNELTKLFIKEELGLTSMEVSINHFAAGDGYAFVHQHKMNEELYFILSGSGLFYVDGEEFPINEGSLIRVAPQAQRALKADTDMNFICIQATENSLKQYTMGDGFMNEAKASWMK